MSPIVANALWIPPADHPTPNLWGALPEPPAALYLKNAYCSLASVRRFHPDWDLVLIHDGDIPQPFRTQFGDINVRLVPVPFAEFLTPDWYPWKGGYYKLEAMAWLVAQGQTFVLLDTDTIVVAPLTELVEVVHDRVGLYLVDHRESHRSRRIINGFAQLLDGKPHRAYHVGGEIVAVGSPMGPRWLAACRELFRELSQRWHHFSESNPDQGDELIVSLAAAGMAADIEWLNPYLRRYWTLKGEANLSTRHVLNPVDIWHLPLEKKAGMLRLYQHLSQGRPWPDQPTLIRWLHLEQGWATGLDWQLRRAKRWLMGGKK